MGRGHDRAHGLQACRAGPSRRRRLPSAPGCEPAHAPACLQPPRRTLAWGCGCVGAWAADAWAAPPTHTTNALPFDEAAVADEALPGLRVVRCQAHSIRYCASTCGKPLDDWSCEAVELWSCCGCRVVVWLCAVCWCLLPAPAQRPGVNATASQRGNDSYCGAPQYIYESSTKHVP